MEKQLLKRIEGMEDNEREKLRELLKDSKQGYVIYLLTYLLTHYLFRCVILHVQLCLVVVVP